jgi:uncharacterized protein (TIGR00299 family) protein
VSERRRVAWFHPFSGIAGDMALGAVLDAGADLAEVRRLLERLPVDGWGLDLEATQRCGIGASRAVVTAAEGELHRTFADIRGVLSAAALPRRVYERAIAVFGALARVEGTIHRRSPDAVEFHEVGSLDAIVDVVGTCAALEVLGVDEVRSGPVAVGLGTLEGSHGTLPNPPPAVVALLVGAPTFGINTVIELTTPTGAAVLAGLASGFGPLPAMTPEAIGYGAGSADVDGRPNVVQVVVGTTTVAATVGSAPGQPVTLLEVNVDDATGEALAHAVGSLLGAGAHDAWITPIAMKKGRPAYTVSVLTDPALAVELAALLSVETGSLGVRGTALERWPRARDEAEVAVAYEVVRVKVGAGRVKVEHDDAVRAAGALGLPVRDVVRTAEAAAERAEQAQQAQQ